VVADAPDRVWAVGFQFDVTTDRRPIKIVSIIDEHTRECLGGMVELSITGAERDCGPTNWGCRPVLGVACPDCGVRKLPNSPK
jgi:putative transposase